MSLPTFADFFKALWDKPPFPWQNMLAERVCKSSWPKAIDLPTAAGKTACIDIAIYALASQAERDLTQRTAPRRIWFVVDRRIVVDAAFERACRIADKLAQAKKQDGILYDVAHRLRKLSGTARPLAVARLRGGILRDDGWAQLPSQPAVIASTVDQIGSRLLFRSYGDSLNSAPIYAGLIANDSLILLDEAHCAQPFLETLSTISDLRSERWAQQPIRTPFAFVALTATHRQVSTSIFPSSEEERAQALNDQTIQQRLNTRKLARLVELRTSKGQKKDPLVTRAAEEALQYAKDFCRVAVMVNRVRTAVQIAEMLPRLANEAGLGVDVVLLTGRLRPYERDHLVKRWSVYLRAEQPENPERPIIVVSTQCLEVGADFSFDALVTECASLDALRQRFGRLARSGLPNGLCAPAVILIRQEDADLKKEDRIYGNAIAQTWQWLRGIADRRDNGLYCVDFGFNALSNKLKSVANPELNKLFAPAPSAPVLLPAHLDLLCQTSPPVEPQPDISLYLHGRRSVPDAYIVWRCDLPNDDTSLWLEIVALCPPSTAEMLSVPFWQLRAWLAQGSASEEDGDLEGASEEIEALKENRCRPALLWRGRKRSKLVEEPEEIRPGDIVVVPASYGIASLGQSAPFRAVGREALDIWEPVQAESGRAAAVRLTKDTLSSWREYPPIAELLKILEIQDISREKLDEVIQYLLNYQPLQAESLILPEWWLDLLKKVQNGHMSYHPAGGVILFQRQVTSHQSEELDIFADDDDLLSAAGQAVSLKIHTESVRHAANKLASHCLPNGFQPCFDQAAIWHDAGKLDERFQLILHNGDEIALINSSEPLAKSERMPLSPKRREQIRQISKLPENFRHEMLSCQLVEHAIRSKKWEDEDCESLDLILYLIATHHGYGRPCAPICEDGELPEVHGQVVDGCKVSLSKDERKSLPYPHRLDSGITERFWRVVRRYGWWGSAYLEAIFRLSDRYGSKLLIVKDEK